MAADRPLTDRGIVEVKMGRWKFPGKPSKIGNRKRVNLSSCALPEDNDSSKAAKNIYLGLSVFNETFGDNEMVAPGPFHGFSMSEVEEAMAEARLQQNKAELEHKKQGIDVNLWDDFQSELFSIKSCSSYDNKNVNKVNSVKLSFDGGGSGTEEDPDEEPEENSEEQPSKAFDIRNSVNKANKPAKSCCKIRSTSTSPPKKASKMVKFHNSRLLLTKLPHSSGSSKSLQSQAAKRLLEKAKMSNTLETNKSCSIEKKFILPNFSIHSSRVIKPNKKFLEETTSKRKLLRSRPVYGISKSKKPKVLDTPEESDVEKTEKKQFEEVNNEVQSEELQKRSKKNENSSSENKVLECTKGSSQVSSSSGKVILREARLQLDNSNSSLLGGPFSSPSASSLSPNSQLKMNSVQSVTAPGSVVCGVCGIVKFYRSVDLAKKFGINCCESCRKFITKIIKSLSLEKNSRLQCVKGKGLCGIVPIVKSQNLNAGVCSKNNKCQACWLKLCLKNFKMSIRLKQKLSKLLPVNMQLGVSLELSPILSSDINSRFLMSNNIKDFKWLKENCSSASQINFNSNNKPNWTNPGDSNTVTEKSLRKRNRATSEKFLTPNAKTKTETDEKNRQSIGLKGPRVKHVCRSASVVLGQPLATFPSEINPTKKNANEAEDDCKNCDNLVTTNNIVETQGIVEKSSADVSTADVKEENKSHVFKQVASSKATNAVQQSIGTKSKKKTNVKTENPVSMDFWESYDPEEVCETGFGLIGSESFSVRALCFLCGSSGQEKLIHCASCCEPYHEFCVNEGQLKLQDGSWKYDWVCPRCTVCVTCGRTSGQQLKCIKCDNSYHTECVDRVGGRLLYSPDRPWVCSICLRCKSCNGIDVSVFVGNLPLCKGCFILRQKGNYCPLCQRCYEDDDYDSKMMECGQCKCWVHAKCEGLSDEKYQVLSFLPESVEYVCRMCCVMPPAPWWVAVEAELKSGYLGVLKALSKNRKACTMLKWSPRKQCTCKQVSSVLKNVDLDDAKSVKSVNDYSKNENSSASSKEESKSLQDNSSDKGNEEKYQPGAILERKTSIEVINHPTESLKLTLKIMKGSEADAKEKSESFPVIDDTAQVKQINKDSTVRVKKCLSNEESSEDSLTNMLDCPEEGQGPVNSFYKGNDFGGPSSEVSDKRLLSSPSNPPSDSGIGSTDDELKASCLTDEESCRADDQQPNANRAVETKSHCDSSVSFSGEKRECFCFLDVDSYNSRSKPFSPNLMSIKKKVTTSEYTSLHQFHQDMQGMIATTQSVELMDLYHQTIKEIFPWFDPKYSRVQSNSQKVSGTMSLESTPVKNTPTKNAHLEECKVPLEKLSNQCLDYFYSGYVVEDDRVCLMCKTVGDGPPGDTGRLLYCGQNEWVHCNCALWSGEVFEEIDGSLQNVQSAISRGRSIRCPECNLKGASIGCCARNCQETYHFRCAREIGCAFMDDKTVYCPAHSKESVGKLVQSEKEFEIRRPVYVELDKRKMKTVDSSQIRFTVGALHVNNLGKFVLKLSDQSEAIIPEQFDCTRLFWSCFEPWRIVRYHFTVRLLDVDDDEGIDYGINLTIDHSKEPEIVELKLKQLQYFQAHNMLLDIGDKLEEAIREKQKLLEIRTTEDIVKSKPDEGTKSNPRKRSKKDQKTVKKVFDHFDSKDDENCLSDNQNTTGLLPPDIEEAIFKDLPNDILDGISMQDIFMDIKNDSYDGNTKEGISEDADGEDISENLTTKSRKQDYHADTATQLDFWIDANEYRQEMTDEALSKSTRDSKKIKQESIPSQQVKKNVTLRTYQKSCGYNWNCKSEGPNNKWKKNPKCHVTVNLLETQDRGNMLQELKFTDGLVSVSTGAIDSVKDLKARMEDKCSIQQEEGKENKCLPWHTRLQPRLLQVDGGVDSSSSGSEAGESPQRVIDENINSKIVPMPQSSPFLESLDYSLNGPLHSGSSSFVPTSESFSCNFASEYSSENQGQIPRSLINSLPQLDGVADLCSDGSDSEESLIRERLQRKRFRQECAMRKNGNYKKVNFKISQCDGGIDSESDEGDSKLLVIDERPICPEEPVKCKRCYCTYRTQKSYQRHLEMCRSDFTLYSSDGEMSEEESSNSQSSSDCFSPKKETENSLLSNIEKDTEEVSIKSEDLPSVSLLYADPNIGTDQNSEDAENLEVKKEKVVKKTYSRKKPPVQSAKIVPATNNVPQVQQIMVQQPNSTPTLIVQDVPAPNVMPSNYTDVGPALGYVSAVEPQNPFAKPQLIATPNGIISGNIQFPPPPETQIVGGLCLNPQNVQANIPGFIIQQAHPPGPIIQQPGPILMSNEQMMLGHQGLYEVIQDPGTGDVFLATRNQPVFYNMETIVSNTVMQTNQFVSNVLGTSFSQTSTQIFQAREMEQMVNVPSNYIVLAPNPPAPDKIFPPEALICVQAPQNLIPNQAPQNLIPNQAPQNLISNQAPQTFISNQAPQALISNQAPQTLIPNQTPQTLIPNQAPQALIPNHAPIQIPGQHFFNAAIQVPPTINTEPKIISTPLNPIPCLQPVQIKQLCPSIVVNKVASPNTQVINPAAPQIFPTPSPNAGSHIRGAEKKIKPVTTTAPNQVKNVPTAKSTSSKSSQRNYDKPVAASKSKPQVQQRSRNLLVDYINNFRSDSCESLKECSPSNHKCDFRSQTSVKREPLEPSTVPVNSSAKVSYSVSSAIEPVPSKITKFSSDSHVLVPTPKISGENVKKSPVKSSGSSIPPVISVIASVPPMPKKDILQFISLGSETNAPNPTYKGLVKDTKLAEVPVSVGEKSEPEVFNSNNNTEKAESVNVSLAKVLTNISNSYSFERDMNSCASLPSLEDSPPPCLPEQPKCSSDTSPNSRKPSGETLPLQDSSQSLNRANSKSPRNMSPVKTKTPPLDEKSKLKKKIITSDQNCLSASFSLENSNEPKEEKSTKKVCSKRFLFQRKSEEKGPKLIFDVISDDGFKSSSTSMVELWANICDSVQEMRAVLKIPPLPVSRKGHEILGMQNHGLQHCLEQLKGVEQCIRYKCRYFIREPQKSDEDETFIEKENLSGSARTEKFSSRKEYDMFAWLASRHRQLPKLTYSAEETLSSIRRANSLPMAMRYRNLKETAKLYVGVYRSKIHGRGLFCLREIEAGEMVIEYAGEVIRSNLTDKREKYYTEKGIGCYMFRIDDHFVVDATMKGNAARFINHSCEPNCYSRVIDILGKKHIVIFALRRINVMEELTYDYKFPFEDEKISCHCLSKKCRKYLN